MHRKLVYGAAATCAAVAGSGAALAVPALAGSGTVTVQTVNYISTIGVASIAPAPAGVAADWVLVDSNAATVEQFDASGVLSTPAYSGTSISSSGYGPFATSAGGTDYVADGTNLLALTSSSGAITSSKVVSTPSGSDLRAITTGPDGDIYLADHSGRILQCPTTGAACTGFAPQSAAPQGITAAGGALWFTDANGDLFQMSTVGSFTPEINAAFSTAPPAITTLGGKIWLVKGTSGSNVIASVDPASPTTTTAYTVTTPSFSGATTPVISAVGAGPDGDLWFTDTANDAVGFLTPGASGDTEYQTAGDIPYGAIVAGPSDTLLFGLRTPSYAVNLLGSITSPNGATTTASTTTTSTPSTSTPSPAPNTPSPATSTPAPTPFTSTPSPTQPATKATLKLTASAAVSAKRVAAVKLSCSGSGSASCAGTLSFTAKLTTTVKQKVKTKVKGKTVTKTKLVKKTTIVTVASGKYSLKAGKSTTLSLKLSAAEFKLLEAAAGRKLKMSAVAKATSGNAVSGTLTLVGPKPAPVKKTKLK